MIHLEICVDSVESAVAAEAGGAQRVELCAALSEGGLTPSLGLIRAVRLRLKIGIHVMIRPRGGDFLYSSEEMMVMKDDIQSARECGVDGVVLGLLTAESEVDVERTRELIDQARPMEVTFHRALDMSRDVPCGFEDVIRTGADRVLTSGGEQSAVLGLHRIREMVEAAHGRIQVMAGGSVRAANAVRIAQTTGVMHFHSGLARVTPSRVKHKASGVHLGMASVDAYARRVVHAEDVRELQEAIAAAYTERGAVT